MDLNTMTTMISTVGFPIFAYILIYMRMEKQDENHKQEMDAVKDALNNNTLALSKLYEKLNMGDEKI